MCHFWASNHATMKSLFPLVQFARGLALAAGALFAVGLTCATESAPKVVLDAAVP